MAASTADPPCSKICRPARADASFSAATANFESLSAAWASIPASGPNRSAQAETHDKQLASRITIRKNHREFGSLGVYLGFSAQNPPKLPISLCKSFARIVITAMKEVWYVAGMQDRTAK